MYKIDFMEKDTSITLFDDVILKYNLLLKKEISNKEIEEMRKENNRLSCFYIALKYIGFKNRSKEEIRKYLKKQNYEEKVIEEAILKLEDQHLINDKEYLKMYVHDQFALTKNGPKKIAYKLMQLGFKEEEIKNELALISKEEWLKRLKDSILKKIKTYKKESPSKIKEKILYTFLNEGYEKESITSILESIDVPKNTEGLKKEVQKLYQKLSLKYQDQDLWYQLKGKLYTKGFTGSEIEEIIQELKNRE